MASTIKVAPREVISIGQQVETKILEIPITFGNVVNTFLKFYKKDEKVKPV